jgi:hypothetical protein
MIEPSGSVASPAFPPSLLALPVDAKVKILAPRMIGQWHAGGLFCTGPHGNISGETERSPYLYTERSLLRGTASVSSLLFPPCTSPRAPTCIHLPDSGKPCICQSVSRQKTVPIPHTVLCPVGDPIWITVPIVRSRQSQLDRSFRYQ